jgi:hypothetical protein
MNDIKIKNTKSPFAEEWLNKKDQELYNKTYEKNIKNWTNCGKFKKKPNIIKTINLDRSKIDPKTKLFMDYFKNELGCTFIDVKIKK